MYNDRDRSFGTSFKERQRLDGLIRLQRANRSCDIAHLANVAWLGQLELHFDSHELERWKQDVHKRKYSWREVDKCATEDL